MNKIFISYKHKASEAFVTQLDSELIHAGVDVYSYKKKKYETKIGLSVKKTLIRQIQKSSHFIYILPKSIFVNNFDTSHIECELKCALKCYRRTLKPHIFIATDDIDAVKFKDKKTEELLKKSDIQWCLSSFKNEDCHILTQKFCRQQKIAYVPYQSYKGLALQDHIEEEISKLTTASEKYLESRGKLTECSIKAKKVEQAYLKYDYGSAINQFKGIFSCLVANAPHRDIDQHYIRYVEQLLEFEKRDDDPNGSDYKIGLDIIRESLNNLLSEDHLSDKAELNSMMLLALVDLKLQDYKKSYDKFEDLYYLLFSKRKNFITQQEQKCYIDDDDVLAVLSHLLSISLTHKPIASKKWLDEISRFTSDKHTFESIEIAQLQLLKAIAFITIGENDLARSEITEMLESASFTKEALESLANYSFEVINLCDDSKIYKRFLNQINRTLLYFSSPENVELSLQNRVELLKLKAIFSLHLDLDISVCCYKEIMSLAPRNIEHKLSLGILYVRMNKKHVAFELFEECIKIKGNKKVEKSTSDYYNLGFCYWFKRSYFKAILNFYRSKHPIKKYYSYYFSNIPIGGILFSTIHSVKKIFLKEK